MSLSAGVFVFTPVIVLFRGFLGVVGLTWGGPGVWGLPGDNRARPYCPYAIDLLKRLPFSSLPSYHGDVQSLNFRIVLAAGGVSGLGPTYSAEFVRLFSSGIWFSSTGNRGSILPQP